MSSSRWPGTGTLGPEVRRTPAAALAGHGARSHRSSAVVHRLPRTADLAPGLGNRLVKRLTTRVVRARIPWRYQEAHSRSGLSPFWTLCIAVPASKRPDLAPQELSDLDVKK